MDAFLSSFSSRSKSPTPKSSRFRRHPPPELHLHSPPRSASASNLLATASALHPTATSNPTASTSNLRAPSPTPDPKKGKRLGMLAQPLAFHLPRAKSPKPERHPTRRAHTPHADPPDTPRTSRSTASASASLAPPPADVTPATPSTSSISSTSTTAPSVPARSPLRGTPRSVASFSSLLQSYTHPQPEMSLSVGLGLATGVGAGVGVGIGNSGRESPGWTQLGSPPSPSVYSPVHSILHPAVRRSSAESHRVRRSASLRGDRLGATEEVNEPVKSPRGVRVEGLRMPTTRARAQSVSSPMMYEHGERDDLDASSGANTETPLPADSTSPRPSADFTSNGRPSTGRRYTTTTATPHARHYDIPEMHGGAVRDSGVAGVIDKDLPPPPPPKLHVRVQSDFTLGPGFGLESSESGESSGFETAGTHPHTQTLGADLPPRPSTSASARTGMFITLPTPTHTHTSESASTMTTASQVSLLLDSPSRSTKLQEQLTPLPESSSLPPSSTSSLPAPKTSKRTHALLELLSSERAYASDLALIRDIYLPLARGAPSSYPLPPSANSLPFHSTAPTPTPLARKKTSQSRNNSTPRISESPGAADEPPMSAQDVKVVFGNIEELAAFADELSDKLEIALGATVPGGSGEDAVGELFYELAPRMTPMYLAYITRHPAAVARYTSLATNPTSAMAQYLATTRAMTSSITHAWDIPSLIIKPLQRLLKYPLILQTILDDTPTSMGHKDRAALSLAKDKMEEVARQVNEGRRRWEVVKGVLESGKSPPAKVGAGLIKPFRGRGSAAAMDPTGDARADLVRLEKRVRDGAAAATAMSEHVLAWATALTAGSGKLLAWSRAFARVVDLDVVLGGDPQGGSEAVRAFTAVAQNLEDLSRELVAVIKEELMVQLARLVRTTREPLLLLSHMHVLAGAHHNLVNAPYAKSRPAAQQEASQAYVALAAQLREELPRYVAMFERAFGIVVLRLSGWQARFFQEAENSWKEFWMALNVEESEVAAGESAAVETVRIWWSRWEETARQTAGMGIVTPGRRVYGGGGGGGGVGGGGKSSSRPSTQQPNTPSSDSASWDYVPPHRPYGQSGSAMSLAEKSSASVVSSKSHGRAVSTEFAPPVARERSTARDAPRVQSEPAPERLFPPSSNIGSGGGTKGKKAQRGSNLRRMTDTIFGGTPEPSTGTNTPSSRLSHTQPVLYAAAAIHPFSPSTSATHLGLPFLTLKIGDTLEILVEAGHPSEHSNLPIEYDDAPDCMLAARSAEGIEGWALASYLMPLT